MKEKTAKTGNTLLLIATGVMLALGGCKKDSTSDNNTMPVGERDSVSVLDNAAVEAAFDDVSGISDEAATGTLTSYRITDDQKLFTTCASISIDTVAIPHRITVDFGTTNCLCHDGNYRRGKIYVDYSGMYRDSGSTHTISFDNYFVNNNQLLGTKTVTNNGHNSNGNLSYTCTVNGSMVWDASFGGGTSTMTSTRTRVWIAGESTWQWNDDVYLISGTASGTTRNGASYAMQTTTPLRKEIGWKHFTSGVLEFTPSGKPTRIIDYSYLNNARDNLARVTISGYSFVVYLN